MEWQDKGSAYLCRTKFEVARWASRACMQKGKIDFSNGDGTGLADFPEAVDFERQIYDASKAGTGGAAQRTIK